MYWWLISKKKIEIVQKKRWENKLQYLGTIQDEEWEEFKTTPFSIFSMVRYQAFQYKVLYRILGFKRYLFIKKKSDTELCELCDEVETIKHALYFCNHSRN